MRPFFVWILFVLVGRETAGAAASAATGREPWRPRFHFTPERNWMNDPNGMVYHDGEYHSFYQYNPYGDRWGHMSWGHAVSRDLVRWEHLPLALAEENAVMIFSGSAVVDPRNSSGFGRDGRPPLVAIYTGHHTNRALQNQQLAYSTDRGRTWTKYAGNPVLDIDAPDFRDPKVFWDDTAGHWVMVVAWSPERKVRFYASPDLKRWRHLSDFGPAGSTTGIWECPDLFPLPIEGGSAGERAWVLVVNVGSGAPAGGSGCQYFVGRFDGTRFQPETAPAAASVPRPDPEGAVIPDRPAAALGEPALWADFGPDFYAAVSWSDIPVTDGRRLWIGWMSNWQYAQDVPTAPWRSAMSVPRELALRRTPAGLRLLQRPVRELAALRTSPDGTVRLDDGVGVDRADAALGESVFPEGLAEIEVEFAVPAGAGRHGLEFRTGADEVTVLAADPVAGRVSLDRTRSGRVDFHPLFSAAFGGPLRLVDGRWRARVLLDTSSVEVFVNDGETVLTGLMFPKAGGGTLRVRAFGGAGDGDPQVRVTALRAWPLRDAGR